MEAYNKVGRGGAGNFYSKENIEDITKTTASDLEAQASPSPSTGTGTGTGTASQSLPEYQHSGRGGAGNWYDPRGLQAQGLKQDDTSFRNTSTESAVDTATAKSKVSSQSKTAHRGRGGAGNYSEYMQDETRANEEEEGRKRNNVERAVEKDVEAGLMRPPKAYGGIGGAYEKK